MTSDQIKKYSKYSQAQLLKKCQTVFNAWIRNRDADLSCISCGTGRVANAGHYLSQGHHSALRFDPNNTNGQCIRCNLFLSGNLINYRRGLIKKIGEDKVIELECWSKKPHKWDRFTLIEIILKYNVPNSKN